MVALLRPQPEMVVRPRQLRLVVDNGPSVGRRRADPGVEVADGGTIAGVERLVMVAIVTAALVVFGGLALIRSSQGGPTAQSWAGVDAVATASASTAGVAVVSPGDQVYVAKSGDSLWSIAQVLAPDSDPRPVVAALIEANGDASLQIGQQIVIPEQLLD